MNSTEHVSMENFVWQKFHDFGRSLLKVLLLLLLFSIMLATQHFWAQIKNLRTGRCEACKFIKYGQIDMFLSDSKGYDVELLEYVKCMRKI